MRTSSVWTNRTMISAGGAVAVFLVCLGSFGWSQDTDVPGYRLGPSDTVSITVFDGNSLTSEELTLAEDGSVLIPFSLNILIQASEMTAIQLRSFIQDGLRTVFRNPVVQVVITGFASKNVLLLGEVDTPGRFSILDSTGLLEFILQHGGFLSDADLSAVQITRASGPAERIDLYEMVVSGRAGDEVLLKPDDIVFVPSLAVTSKKYFILGEVRQPGLVESPTPLTLMEAIVEAGTLTPEARADRLMLVRMDAAGETSVIEIPFSNLYENGDTTANVTLQGGDIVYVPRNRTTRIADILGAIAPVTSLVRDTVFLIDILRR